MLVSKKVITKILADRLPLIFLINFISHPSDRFDKVDPQLFPEIFNVSIHYPFIAVKVVFPQPVQQILPREHTSLMRQKLPQHLKFPLCELKRNAVYRGGIAVQVQNEVLISDCPVLLPRRPQG